VTSNDPTNYAQSHRQPTAQAATLLLAHGWQTIYKATTLQCPQTENNIDDPKPNINPISA